MRHYLLVGVAALLVVGTASAQNDRRDRENPELIVESESQVGSCDSLQFTKDGKFVLAVGDDKVVRMWPYRDGQLQKEGMQVLRWSTWREQRGAIFTLALSPDDENKYVAIAGVGAKTSDVAVLERSTGKMVYHAVAAPPKGEFANALWSMAYAPDGKSVAFGDSFGGVWTWDFKDAPRRLGKHPAPSTPGFSNKVRFVHFFKKNLVVSVAENGTGCQWDPTNPTAEPVPMKTFGTEGQPIFRVALSPDEQWFAVALEAKPRVVLRNADPTIPPLSISLKDGEFARAVAFDRDSKRLAVSVAHTHNNERGFWMEDEDRIVFYDLNGEPAKQEGPRGIYHAWCLAFHPNKKDLALAGGDNNEVTLWNLAKMDRPGSVMDGVGKALWDVALSQDGKQIAFRDERNPRWTSPNDRAQGSWRVFHLMQRKWTDSAPFAKVKVEPRVEYKGWTVEPAKPGGFQWYAVNEKEGKKLLLGHDFNRDGIRYCWTFLPPGDGRPLRLAMGHLWGVSIYELTETKKGEAKFVRLLTGHQNYVTALAATEDGSYLVSASMDQTISGWNLANNWESQATLGASFEFKGDKLVVKQVDVGSPGWEAGLVAGDEVVDFYFAGKHVDNGPQAWHEQLKNPQPGTEHRFEIRRKGKDKTFPLATTVRQRPLWRFFPMRDNEWVLWMWQGSYYDTSTKGDTYIGWVVNSADENREPAFYRAEQFRAIYERADVLDKLLDTHDVQAALREAQGANPLPPKFSEKEPPFAEMKLVSETTKDDDVKVTLIATPHGTNPDYQPARAELWINGLRYVEDKQPKNWDRDGTAYRKIVTIPNKKLRAGENVLTFQVYNEVGGRVEVAKVLQCMREAPPPRLFGEMVGVNDYGAIKVGPGGRGKLVNLESACRDAEEMQKSWLAQKTMYKGTDVFLNLDAKAKRDDIIAALDKLADQVGPEDRCIIFLAGHGQFVQHKATKDTPPTTTWLFCCPDYDVSKPEETSITSEVLYAKLAKINGRKLVILDACHSGEAAANPVRSLVPGGQGPTIIASCDRNQSAFEDTVKLKHGLFTYALIQALGEDFDVAAKGKKELDARDLFLYTRERMPGLLKDIKAKEFDQVPVLFAPPGKPFTVARAKE